MRYKITIIATLIGLAVCAFNYTGYDPHNMVFFMFSVPAWFADMFMDIHNVSVLLMYALTVLTWALLGFITDLIIARDRRKNSSTA
ncbi:hypothetical protein B1748_07445 [Paenibacillus sp. MY03]|jgi:hypothetical protein|uniref:Uncharacterized protein n=1 Tax=Paenibacillus agaridevorans TaxID=171404 RepID=A0A2R5EZZ6_9BACL|nr:MULTISPECIES: hypothetical protein [Paenibacillus]OUS77619.1 hypothetical protein B1748_07445 [Paenibacillus sp. MY03]GBG12296.1 hypothetical protein PAT3040_07169 [Paenibacillus agaridevorans]